MVCKQSIKESRCVALNQYYKSIISDEIFNNFSNELTLIVIYMRFWINILNLQIHREK